jgi:hypothetical protein
MENRRESEMAWVEKWPLEKTPEYFNINRTNKMSIKGDINLLGDSNFTGLLCRDLHSP